MSAKFPVKRTNSFTRKASSNYFGQFQSATGSATQDMLFIANSLSKLREALDQVSATANPSSALQAVAAEIVSRGGSLGEVGTILSSIEDYLNGKLGPSTS